jgi:hypothetical protein
LNESFSGSKNIYKLLGVVLSAHRPKPCADTAGHNNTEVVLIHITKDWLVNLFEIQYFGKIMDFVINLLMD